MLTKLFTIAKTTCLETIRQPVYGVLLWVGVGLLVLNPSLAAFSLESGGDIKIAIDVGLATLLLYGLLASVFSATSVITREIEAQTVLTVVSKPVNRATFLTGKYLGVCVAVLIGYYFLTHILLMTVRHGTMETAADKWDQPVLIFSIIALAASLLAAGFSNFVYGWHFPTTLLAFVVPLMSVALLLVLLISPDWEFQSIGTDFGDMQMVYALTMCFGGVLILTAFAVALATRFSQVVTLLLCAGVYMVGLLSDHYLGRPATETTTILYDVLYAAVPNFQFFWAGDAITQEQIIPATQVGHVVAYAGAYSLGVLALGIALFETREVG